MRKAAVEQRLAELEKETSRTRTKLRRMEKELLGS